MSDDALAKWKNKYYSSLDTLEKMEKDWASMSAMISRSIIRITTATEGLDPKLDEHLKDVRVVISAGELDTTKAERMDALCNSLPKGQSNNAEGKPVEVAESAEPKTPKATPVPETKKSAAKDQLGLFSRLLDRVPPPKGKEKKVKALRKKLTEKNAKARATAIEEILLIYGAYQQETFAEPVDASQPEKSEEGGFLKRIFKSAVDEESKPSSESAEGPDVRDVLMQLIDGLALPPIFTDRINEFKEELSTPEALEQWVLILSGIIELILEIQMQVSQEKSELQDFLGQVTVQLQELDNNLGLEREDQKAFLAEGEKLNSSVNGQVDGIQSSVDEATDLSELKDSIASRLEHIRSHMEDYQTFGNDRAEQAEKRIQEMNKKIKSLENETKDLKDKIVQEHQQALMDALTEVPNRMAYNEQMKKEYARWKRYKEPLSIIIWDIDFFKKVNDNYGHQAGDNALKFIATILSKRVRETDFLARFGGEEFVILLPKTSAEEAETLANVIRETIQGASFHYSGKKVSITVSGGVSEFKKGDKPEDVFNRADKALYVCKENGRNCVTIK